MPSVFTHKLALALQFSDATDGRGIENDIRISVNGRPKRPMPKPGGYFIFMADDLPEESFDMDIAASGYVPTKKRILLEAPGIGPPLLRVEMIPEDKPLRGGRLCTLSGTCKGLSAIDAVKLGSNACVAGTFDARKRTLRVYNPYRLEFNRPRYALVDSKELRYEIFMIESRVSDGAFIIDHPFVSDVSADFTVAPVVAGDVNAKGEYLLRVRDDATDNRFIVRFAEDAGERFEIVDFTDADVLRRIAAAPKSRAKTKIKEAKDADEKNR
ncbi:MAG: hypothetical protein LBK57_11065 [Clostridiales Family XIII bacterium]|jgi:hypothetical protein|nr:hypothetical protein [Clostridiales Family XIII bacterium]